VRAIRAGERITGDLIRVETGIGMPASIEMATEPEQVVGKTSRRLLPSGSPIRLDSLEQTATVARGDPMQVDVISGRARVRFDGIAQATAGAGQVVAVRMRDSGRIIHARVSGQGRAVLDVTPAERENP
jgi:flagella basal body P-ring formation protein FlgA